MRDSLAMLIDNTTRTKSQNPPIYTIQHTVLSYAMLLLDCILCNIKK